MEGKVPISYKCLGCYNPQKKTKKHTKVYRGSVNNDKKNLIERYVCSHLRQHLSAAANKKCFEHYQYLGRVKTRKGIACVDISTSVFSPDHQLGIGLRCSGATFNRSMNNQTVYEPVQNMSQALIDSIGINYEGRVGYWYDKEDAVEDDNSVSGSEDQEEEDFPVGNELELENELEVESETLPELDAPPGPEATIEFDNYDTVIDVTESEFMRPSIRPQMAVELELMNIITNHKMPLAAFQTIYDWAVRSQNRKGFCFTEQEKSRKREAVIKELMRDRREKKVDQFEPRCVEEWLPHDKPVEVWVRDFQVALRSLLSNKSLMKEENLSFPDPEVPYIWKDYPEPSDSTFVKELKDGKWWVKTWKESCTLVDKALCGNPEEVKEILVPVIFYDDSISLDNHNRLSLQPLNFTLGIFNTETRKRPDAFETIFFHPNEKVVQNHHNSLGAKPPEKLKNLHNSLRVALQSYHDTCELKRGILVKNLPYGGKQWNVKLKFSIAFFVGDNELHDQLCARKKTYTAKNNADPTKSSYLCRHCNINSVDLVKPECQAATRLWTPEDFVFQSGETEKNDHYPVENAFDRFDFGFNKHKIHWATPGELLHTHQLGCAKRCVESFRDHYIFDKAKDNSTVQEKLVCGTKRRRSDDEDKSVEKGVVFARFSRLSQAYGSLLSRQSDRDFPRTRHPGANILQPTMKEGKHYAGILVSLLLGLLSPLGQDILHSQTRHRDGVVGFIETIEWLLGMEEFLKNGGITVGEIPNFRSVVDTFINLIVRNCPRGGQGTLLLKNHLYFHLPRHMLFYGPIAGWDSSFQESAHKTEIKAPSKKTQRRATELIKQTATRKSEERLFRSATMEFLQKKSFVIDTQKERPMHGPRYVIKNDADGEPQMVWKDGRNSNRAKLAPEVLRFVSDKIFPLLSVNELTGFTEHQRTGKEDGTLYRFRAHPSFHSKDNNNLRCNVWHDWAMVRIYGDQPAYPCHIMCFLQIQEVANGKQFLDGFKIEAGLYAVVRMFQEPPLEHKVGPTRSKYQYVSRLVKKGTLERTFRVVSCDSIEDEVAVVPMITSLDDEGGNYFEYDSNFFVVDNRNGWCRFFLDEIRKAPKAVLLD